MTGDDLRLLSARHHFDPIKTPFESRQITVRFYTNKNQTKATETGCIVLCNYIPAQINLPLASRCMTAIALIARRLSRYWLPHRQLHSVRTQNALIDKTGRRSVQTSLNNASSGARKTQWGRQLTAGRKKRTDLPSCYPCQRPAPSGETTASAGAYL